MKGQVAVEYLIVVGIALTILIPIFLIFSTTSVSFVCNIHQEQARTSAEKIAQASETISYLGSPSKTELKVRFPASTSDIRFSGYEISVDVCSGQQEVVVASKINVTGNTLTGGGIHYLSVESKGNYIEIS